MACRIAAYTKDMKRGDVENSFRSALKIWSDVTRMKFIKVNTGKADIVFSFARKSMAFQTFYKKFHFAM